MKIILLDVENNEVEHFDADLPLACVKVIEFLKAQCSEEKLKGGVIHFLTGPEDFSRTVYNCIISGEDPTGQAGMLPVRMACTDQQYKDRDHVDAAFDWAKGRGYDPKVLFEERNGPAKLFELFDWVHTEIVSV